MDKDTLWAEIVQRRPDLAARRALPMPDEELISLHRSVMEMSLGDMEDALRAALEAREKGAWLNSGNIYGAYIIYELDGKFYRLPYAVMEGQVQLGETAAEVERVWVEARSAQAENDDVFNARIAMGSARDPEGAAWDVTICQPGFTLNGWYLPEDVIRDAAGLFEGVDVNLYQLPQPGEGNHVPDALFPVKNLLVKNKAGWIDGVRFVAGAGLKGVLHFLESAKWLGTNLLRSMQSGTAAYGLSYDCPTRAKRSVIGGRTVFEAVKFLAADSVDIVTRPAAGGKFDRAIAALETNREVFMEKQQLWDLIMGARPDLLNGKTAEGVTDDELTGLARMAMLPPAQGTPDKGDQPVTQKDLDSFRCSMALDDGLKKSELPDAAQDRIRAAFRGRIFETNELDQAIGAEKDYIAKMSRPADGDPVPSSGVIVVGIGTIERAQMAVDKLFGLTAEDMTGFATMRRLDNQPFFADIRSRQSVEGFADVPTFRGLREMYEFFTGDSEVAGFFNRDKLPPDLRAKMAITSSTFSYVLGNTLARRMVKDYLANNFHEDLLISVRKPVKDFRTQEAVNVGYFSDLDTVDPESGDYEEISAITDEESTYTIGQKGNILIISRKTIINDDLSLILRLVSRLGRAARRTHAKYIWDLFISNGTCSDGTAWFTSGHGNLGATALSFATALVAYKALAGMTEKDSAETIGLLDDPSIKPNIIYPVALMETGEQIVNDDTYYSSNDLTTKTRNALKGKVNGAMVSLLSDANDWGMLMPPDVVDMVEMGYLNGRQEPEMFVADMPQSEQVFVADKIRHKIRHEYAGTVVDYRSGYKAVVA